jgi:hypothetical protein
VYIDIFDNLHKNHSTASAKQWKVLLILDSAAIHQFAEAVNAIVKNRRTRP